MVWLPLLSRFFSRFRAIFSSTTFNRCAQFFAKYRRRIQSLFVPYLIWSGLGIVTFLLLQMLPWAQQFNTNPERVISNLTAADLLKRWMLNPIPYQLWFLRDLIVMVAISPVIYVLIRRFGLCVMLPLGGAAILISQHSAIEYRASYEIVRVEGLFFFMLGSYLALRGPFNLEYQVPGRRILLVGWFCFLAVRTYFIVCEREIAGLDKVSVGLGVPAVWLNYDFLELILASRVSLWLAHFTFFVYAAHYPLIAFLLRLFLHYFGASQGSHLLAFMLLPPLVITVCVCAAVLVRRLASPVYLVLTGGR